MAGLRAASRFDSPFEINGLVSCVVAREAARDYEHSCWPNAFSSLVHYNRTPFRRESFGSDPGGFDFRFVFPLFRGRLLTQCSPPNDDG